MLPLFEPPQRPEQRLLWLLDVGGVHGVDDGDDDDDDVDLDQERRRLLVQPHWQTEPENLLVDNQKSESV